MAIFLSGIDRNLDRSVERIIRFYMYSPDSTYCYDKHYESKSKNSCVVAFERIVRCREMLKYSSNQRSSFLFLINILQINTPPTLNGLISLKLQIRINRNSLELERQTFRLDRQFHRKFH